MIDTTRTFIFGSICMLVLAGNYAYQNQRRPDTSHLREIVQEPAQKYRFTAKCPKDTGVEYVEYISERKLETKSVCRGK